MNATAPNPSLQRKHAARIVAVQTIYSQIMDPAISLRHMLEWQQEQIAAKDSETTLSYAPDKKLLQTIVRGVEEAFPSLESKLLDLLGDRWSAKRMPMVMRAILMAALYELMYTPSLRTSIIIDQYVGVADAFLDESDIGFVNGVLQEITTALRPVLSASPDARA